VAPPENQKASWWTLIIPVGLLLLVVFVLIEVFGVIPD
jgi:hypothetical protein